MNIIFSSIAILICLQYLGFGFSRLVFKRSSDKTVCFAPTFGLGYLMATSWWAYRLGFRLDSAAIWAMVIPPLVLSTIMLLAEAKASWRGIVCLGHQWLRFGVIWLLALGILAIPLLFHPDALILTFGNNDIVHHTTISRFLLEQGRAHPAGFAAQYPHAFLWFADNTFFGYYSFVANVAALSGQLPHEVVSSVLCCIAALNTGPVFLLARRVLAIKKHWASLWAVLGAAHALVLYIVYNGFGGQIFGTYFGFALLYFLVCEQNPRWNSVQALSHSAVLGVLMGGLMLSYPHMLPFVGGVALFWRIVEGLQRRSHRWLPGWIISGLLGTAACGLAIPNRLWAFYLWIKQAAADQSGWTIKFLWPDYLLGLVGAHMNQVHVALPQTELRIGVMISLAAVFWYRFRFGSAIDRPRLLGAIAGFGAIYACAFFFAVMDSGEVFGSYKAFKVLSYFSALFALIVAACWMELWRQGIAGRICAGLFLTGYLAVWGESIVAMRRGDGRGNLLTRESARMVALDRSGAFASLNIVTENYWVSMWLVYFFLNKQVYQAYRSYYPPTRLEGQVGFAAGNSKFVVVKDDEVCPIVFGLEYFSGPRHLTVRLGSGWHGPESDHEWMGANGTDAEIEIFVFGELHEISAIVHLQPYLPANSYSVLWNDTFVAKDLTTDIFTLQLRDLRPGKNILLLRSKLPPLAPGGGDPRPICFGLRQLELNLSN